MKKEFTISNIDPLGQGTAKEEGAITFIKKTLPEEIVEAEVFSKKKGVQFANLVSVLKPSPRRQDPECPHFASCNGCDYQHTDYDYELEFKKNALKRHLVRFPEVEITAHGSGRRFGYRNRIQLHYDKKKKVMGLLTSQHQILPIPDCKIINPSVAHELRNLYKDNNWAKLVAKQPPTGHLEIYHRPSSEKGHNVNVSVNRPYANGGFTQVNYEMNQKLIEWLTAKTKEVIPPKSMIYDLFGGNGNLSAKFINSTLVVDVYKTTPENKNHQKFFSQNLYDENAIKNLIKLKNEGIARPDWIIFDPPRSGLKNINEFLNEFRPQGFIFIACEATSFARDMYQVLEHYELKSVDLFDLFPSTQHFETVGIFTRRDNKV